MSKTIHLSWVLGAGAVLASAQAAAVELKSGDWTFTVNGNVNVHYIHSSCERHPAPIVTVGGACTPDSGGEDNTSSISNGLLPASIKFGVTTTQLGYDIGVHFGFYPGVSTNDGGSPNLGGTNTALGTTGLDVRQVFMTFGNADMGTFLFGRNFGLFQFDAIINDMTLPGVGAGNGNYASPSNTSLGSIGFGYIYTDTLAQMNYTTPSFYGATLTLGIFDPVEPLLQGTATAESTPGFHGKLAWTYGDYYLSTSFLSQKQQLPNDAGDYNSFGVDVTGKAKFGPVELLASYYDASGVGTTGLFVLGDDGNGHKRDSDGYFVQATWTIAQTKIGANYGVSKLDYANAADAAAVPNLVEKNSKYTLGVYHALTPNLTLLGEFSDVKTEAHDGAENQSSNFNVGAYLSF
ncbi:porin [Solimonas flava]|uniref:porin n=1 Tax=Solimonas flava TaxID=415849 RepID=UPI0004117806|nr:porin [Solimonas flava]